MSGTKLLHMRSGPNAKSDNVILDIPQGEQVDIISTSGKSWYKVKYKGKTGYVMTRYITKGKAAASAKTDKKASSTKTSASGEEYSGKPTAKTLKPGAKGPNVKRVQSRLKSLGFYSGEISGKYDDLTKEAVRKFQRKKGLNANGVIDASTMEKLYPASKYGGEAEKELVTERLDWFAGNQNKIPKHAVCEVKDCATGRKFKIKRWSGANHMDVEPLTANDTAVMMSLYGGNWSWKRRAILVKYNNHVYAGSMNGMPHGTTTISANNFAGHFCIHFLNSMTHGSKRVDPDHQSCVNKALKYTW